MKLILTHVHHTPSASLISLVKKHLERLQPLRQIDEARIVLEQSLELSPPFRCQAHLVTPGPDVRVEAVDHTLRAALEKTVNELERQIGDRVLKRVRGGNARLRMASPGRSATVRTQS